MPGLKEGQIMGGFFSNEGPFMACPNGQQDVVLTLKNAAFCSGGSKDGDKQVNKSLWSRLVS